MEAERRAAVMISQRNVLASLIQVAVAGGIEPPNPILEVCIRALAMCGTGRRLTQRPAENPTCQSRFPADLPHVRAALCGNSACVDGAPDSRHAEVERGHRPRTHPEVRHLSLVFYVD